MATNQAQLAGVQAGLSELRSRLLFVLFALLVYRVGTHIPIPGINPEALAQLFEQNQGGIMDLLNMFSGGALERMSILALGPMPLHHLQHHHEPDVDDVPGASTTAQGRRVRPTQKSRNTRVTAPSLSR